MPRIGRLHIPGGYYHVMGHGLEKRYILESSADKLDFLARFGENLNRSDARCFSSALMSNHYHFLIQAGNKPLAKLIATVLGGLQLPWRLSNTMDFSLCVDALNEVIENYGVPAIFNADQGSQFTSEDFTGVLKQHEIAISMNGRGRWMDNVFVERLWRSVKYEEVYLKGYEGMREAKASLGRYFEFYNAHRRHQSLDKRTPDDVYYKTAARMAA